MLCYKYFLPNQVFYTSSYCFSFRIPSTSYFSSSFTSTGFGFSIFCLLISSLYITTLQILTTRCIFIENSSLSLTIFSNTIYSIVYGLTYHFISFLASLFVNTKFFVLRITLLLGQPWKEHGFYASSF